MLKGITCKSIAIAVCIGLLVYWLGGFIFKGIALILMAIAVAAAVAVGSVFLRLAKSYDPYNPRTKR